MSLQTVSQALAEHLDESRAPTAAIRQEKIERWGKITGVTGIALLLLVLIAAFVSLLFSKLFGVNIEFFFDSILPVIASIAIPLMLVGAGLVIAPRLTKELFGARSSKRSLTAIHGEPTPALPVRVDPEQSPSITERTTAHLDMRDESTEASRDTQPRLTSGPD